MDAPVLERGEEHVVVGGQAHEADGKALLFVTQEGFHKALDIDFVGVARVLEGVSPVERGRDECETKGGFCYAGLIVAAGLVAEDDIVCRCERGELIVAEAAPDHGESKKPSVQVDADSAFAAAGAGGGGLDDHLPFRAGEHGVPFEEEGWQRWDAVEVIEGGEAVKAEARLLGDFGVGGVLRDVIRGDLPHGGEEEGVAARVVVEGGVVQELTAVGHRRSSFH